MKQALLLGLFCLCSCQWPGNTPESQGDQWLESDIVIATRNARPVADKWANTFGITGRASPFMGFNSAHFALLYMQPSRRSTNACQAWAGANTAEMLDMNYRTSDFFTVLDSTTLPHPGKVISIQKLDANHARIIGLPKQNPCTPEETKEFEDSAYQADINKVKASGGEIAFACFHSNSDTVLATYAFLPVDTVYKVQWLKDPDDSQLGTVTGSLLRFQVPSRGIAFDLNYYPCS